MPFFSTEPSLASDGEAAASEGQTASAANAARVYASQASEAVTQSDYGPVMWRRVVNRAIVAAAAIQPTSEFGGTYGQTEADAARGVHVRDALGRTGTAARLRFEGSRDTLGLCCCA